MTGTAIPATWRSMRPGCVLSCAVVRSGEPSNAKQFRLGGRPRVPG